MRDHINIHGLPLYYRLTYALLVLEKIFLYLGNTGSDDSNADFRDQFDRDACLGVGALEVVDELGEVLNGVDVVVRRRGDQPHARHRAPRARYVLRHLVAWRNYTNNYQQHYLFTGIRDSIIN